MPHRIPARASHEARLVCSLLFLSSCGSPLPSALRELAGMVYSPAAREDSCHAALGILESLYSSMRACQSNDDCAYLNEAFEPIPHQTLPFGSCSVLVANRAEAFQSRETLISARDRVNQSCGGQREMARCQGSRRFMSHSPAPLCRERTCVVPSD